MISFLLAFFNGSTLWLKFYRLLKMDLEITFFARECSSNEIFFPVLHSPIPIYACAGILLVCNLVFLFLASGQFVKSPARVASLAMVQLEIDLLMLTALLYFAGGLTNPFVLFYWKGN